MRLRGRRLIKKRRKHGVAKTRSKRPRGRKRKASLRRRRPKYDAKRKSNRRGAKRRKNYKVAKRPGKIGQRARKAAPLAFGKWTSAEMAEHLKHHTGPYSPANVRRIVREGFASGRLISTDHDLRQFAGLPSYSDEDADPNWKPPTAW